jgi:hypothetical protein
MMGARRIDGLNIALIGVTCALAHLFPFHLLIFSYAVLGPAHYLTQISWLHDRRYFVANRWLPNILIALAFALVLNHDQNVAGILSWLALIAPLAAVTPVSMLARMAIIVGGVIAVLPLGHWGAITFIAVLLPTVLHVFVFTAIFMWVGARRTRLATGYLAFAALLLGGASFLLPLPEAVFPPLNGLQFFTNITEYLRGLLPTSAATTTGVFGFLSFAYTYHYLNWFSKAEIIKWHNIPRRRFIGIVVVYLVAVAVYAVRFDVGFSLLGFISLAHVLLEFPLNIRSFAEAFAGRPAVGKVQKH